jgi:hypothetical protein
MRVTQLAACFVEFVPDVLEDGILYVSMEHATVVHRCACGCARKVVTPLSPTDWQMKFDGRDVSLTPSIGNWNFPCRSHYWIREGKPKWAGGMCDNEVALGREHDRFNKWSYYQTKSGTVETRETYVSTATPSVDKPRRGLVATLRRFIRQESSTRR